MCSSDLRVRVRIDLSSGSGAKITLALGLRLDDRLIDNTIGCSDAPHIQVILFPQGLS